MNTERITSIPVNYYKTRDGKHEVPVVDLRLLGHTGTQPIVGTNPDDPNTFRQWSVDGSWVKPGPTMDIDLMIPPPEPVFGPLTPEDVPPGSDFISPKGTRLRYEYLDEFGAALEMIGKVAWVDIMVTGWSILTPDMRKLPCKKEVKP